MSSAASAGPLAGIKVLDLTRVRAGPTAVRLLGDWGADVIKIETPASVDAGEMSGSREGSDFQNLQRNKRSLTLNLKKPEGLALFRRMVEAADVVVENYRPDVKDKLGIDYESLRAVNPRIVLASISGFGQTGPYAKRPGFDQVAQGLGGLMSITGLPGQGPVRAGIPLADLSAGHFAAQGILLALFERERSGEGQWVQTSLLQAQIFMLDFQAARWLNEGEVPKQAGNDHPTSIPTGVFKTRDGYINVATAGGAIWERFAKALGRADWIENPAYKTGPDRSKNRAELNAEIAEIVAHEDSATWVERLNQAGVPSGPIYAMDEMFADPQVEHLDVHGAVPSPHVAGLRLLRQPVTLSRTPSRLERHPPARGEHTDEILRELGLDDNEIAAFRRDTVV